MKEDWTYKKLEEVCSLITKGTTPTSLGFDFTEQGVAFVKIESLTEDGGILPSMVAHISDDCNNALKRSQLEELDILYSIAGALGRVAIVPKSILPANTNQALAIIRLRNKEIGFIRFLKYFLTSRPMLSAIMNLKVGVAQQNLSLTQIRDLTIPIPPITEQSRIVSELDLLQSIIDKQKAQLNELDNLAQAVFYDMFGDPVENEKGWDVKKLGEECTEMKYGTSRPSCENGEYPYLRMCNISSDGHLDLDNLKTISIPDDEVEKCIVRYGDILFNRTNSIELIGKTCMFDLETPMIIAGYIIRVRLSEKLESRFVSCMFNMPSMKKLLRTMAKGAVNQANINSKELASIIIPIPQVILQHSFAAKIDSIEKQKAAITQSIAETQRLFDYTMDKYFG